MNFNYHLNLYASESLSLFQIEIGKKKRPLFDAVFTKISNLIRWAQQNDKEADPILNELHRKIEHLIKEWQEVHQNLCGLLLYHP